MRKKEQKLLITFHTTADAMAMEQRCRMQQMPGRLIPVPGEISAGCGLAWCAGTECRGILTEMMKNAGIKEEAIHECLL